MPSPVVTGLLQNALTDEERSRVLVLYACGLLDTLWRRAGKPKRRTARVKRWRGAPHRKKLLPPGQRQRRTAGSQRARGAQGKGGATPVPARVEELLAWVRRVMERPSEEDVFTTVLHLLKSV